MKKLFQLLFFMSFVSGLVYLSSCSDDDAPPPADPTVALNAAAVDANRGATVTIEGTVTAAGGLASFSADVTGVTITGVTEGSTDAQDFTATFTVASDAVIGSTIPIVFSAIDDLGQESANVTFTITVVPQGAPTIAIVGDATADAKRREEVSITLNITAAEGIDELVVTDGDGASVATVAGADITDPSNFTWEYTVPDGVTVGNDIVLNHNVTDNAGQTTTTAAVFTVTVLAFDEVTLEFTNFDESPADTAYSSGADVTVTFTVSKDDLVEFDELAISKSVNGDDPTVSTVDISDETGPEIVYAFTVAEQFLDEVDLILFINDEFDNESELLELSYDVLTTTGDAFVIDDQVVGSTNVKRVRGKIDEDVTFMSSNDYYLSGEVEVADGATLTIQAGTTIYAETDNSSALDIDDSGVIMAMGTSMNPIVFTSGAGIEGGTAEAGDWNFVQIEGDEDVNSGTFQYVRIEYAGGDAVPAFELDKVDELTTISFVQVFESADQGIEINGGNVHLSNIVVTTTLEQGIELDDDDDVPFEGSMQFVIIESSETLEKGARDFEVRDDSDPLISNITIIGSGKEETMPDRDLSAVRIRDDAGGMGFYNMIIAEYSDDGFRFDPVGVDQTLGGDFVVANSYIFRIGDDPTRDDSDPDNLPLIYETDAGTYSNTIDKDNIPAAAAGIGIADFVPDAAITTGALDPTTLGAQFQAGTYVGAIGSTDWTLGWVKDADGTIR